MPPFELREALRYMGVRGEPTTELMQLAQEAGTLLTKAANYRWRSVRLPLHRDGSALLLGELPLTGQSIRRHLDGCTEAILLCGTLGSGVDQLIRREMLLHPARALAVNGCASALLEARLDDTCAKLAQTLHTENLTLTSRFSPGYGDLPLSLQGPLLALLEAYRIGLVNNVYPAEELMPAAKKLASTIARNAPIAVRNCKRAINEGIQVDMDQAIVIEEKLFGSCFETCDQKEGMNAFLEKRKVDAFLNK